MDLKSVLAAKIKANIGNGISNQDELGHAKGKEQGHGHDDDEDDHGHSHGGDGTCLGFIKSLALYIA